MSKERPLAFVIMPFDSALDAVYRDLIRSTLEEVGFTVERADDIVAARNILDDIVAKLADADFVVADLTDLNPNVFYELGIAHAMNGRVLMMTQDVSSLPFDLQSYRVLEYDTHFSRFNEARLRLKDFATAAIDGKLPFGSPVSDFAKTQKDGTLPVCAAQAEELSDLEDGEAGLLDHLLEFFDSGQRLTTAIEEIGAATELVGVQITDATSQLTDANAIQDPVMQTRASHSVIRQVGLRMNEYARFLDERNTEYEDALATFGTSFEAALTAQPPEDDESRASLSEQMATLIEWERTIVESRASTLEFAETVRTTPRVEKYSSKAMGHAYSQLQRLIANMDQTSSMLARVQRVVAKIVDDAQG